MRALVVVALALVTAACGTTRIVASDRDAKIYIDGELAGRGSASLTRRGFPSGFDVSVESRDGRRVTRRIARKFTALTFGAAFITYGICLLACWELPADVMLEVPGGGWEDEPTPEDPWMSMGLDTREASE